MSVESRLEELGIALPQASAAAGNYVATVVHDGVLYVSGQISRNSDGTPLTGRLGDTMNVEDGQIAAHSCALQILAAAKAELGSLDKISKIIKLSGYVASTHDFTQHPAVINGASDLLASIFGAEIGAHTRAAVGMSSLPLGVAVEIDAIIAVR